MISVNRDELIQGYRAYLKARGLKAWDPFRWHLGIFLNWLDQKQLSLSEISQQRIEDYLRYRKSLGQRVPVTAALDALRSFLRYARHAGLVSGDPTQGVSCGWLDMPGGYPAYHGALRQILTHPAPMVRHRFPMLASEWEQYLRQLLAQGFHRKTLQEIVFRNSLFSQYLVQKGIRKFSRIRPTHLDDFLRAKWLVFQKKHGRPPCRQYLQRVPRYIKGFLTFAFAKHRRSFENSRPTPDNAVIPDRLLKRYLNFCHMHRGLQAVTRNHHLCWLEQLRFFLRRRSVPAIRQTTVADLDAFTAHLSKRMGARALAKPMAAIRAFFRYLYLEGEMPRNPADQLYSPCRFRSDQRPKYIPWSKIQRILDGVDRAHPIGKRDYAILLLLACHGLRAREVAHIKIQDIDWRGSALWIKGRKNQTSVQLPLLPAVGNALKDYLAVRPASAIPEVFLAAAAPLRPVGHAVSAVVQTHLRKHLDGRLSTYGAYVLRHSFAKSLLDRGARLDDVKTLLGHKLLRSTLVYAKIHTEELREVADNYANLL